MELIMETMKAGKAPVRKERFPREGTSRKRSIILQVASLVSTRERKEELAKKIAAENVLEASILNDLESREYELENAITNLQDVLKEIKNSPKDYLSKKMA